MAREVTFQSKPIPAVSLLALALGAAAFGAVAIGALAIGRLVVGHLVIKKARFNALEVDELTVRKLRVVEHEGPHLVIAPECLHDRGISSVAGANLISCSTASGRNAS